MTSDEFDAWYATESERDGWSSGEWYALDDVSHNSPLDAFVGFLGLCGCGSDEPRRVIARTLWALWESHKAHESGVPFPERAPWSIAGADFYHQPIVELVLHIFDGHGVVTHGGSVGGSWLEPLGVVWAERVFSPWTPEPDDAAPKESPRG